MRERHIVVMGGGGFSMEPRNTLLDDFVIGLTRTRLPRICFIGTASGDDPGYIRRFYSAFPKRRAIASHLGLFDRSIRNLEEFILHQDAIYVGGGNTANLLAVWRVHGLDKILMRAWRAGIVMAGVSAGAMCWFEVGVTDSFGQGFHRL